MCPQEASAGLAKPPHQLPVLQGAHIQGQRGPHSNSTSPTCGWFPRGERASQHCPLQGSGVSVPAHMASCACKAVPLTHSQPCATVSPRLTRRSELHSLTSICLQDYSLKAGPWESVAWAQAATHRKSRLPRATSVDSYLVRVLIRWEFAGSDLTLGEPQSPTRGQWLPLNVTSAWDSVQKTSQVENNSKTNAPQQFHSQPNPGMTMRGNVSYCLLLLILLLLLQ